MKTPKTLAAALATALLSASLLTAEANTIPPTPILTPGLSTLTNHLDLTNRDLVPGAGIAIFDFAGYLAIDVGIAPVPEGGSSLAFLGLALVALEALRRKLASQKSAL